MATLLSITDGGNMMTASTWGVVEPTSFQGTPTTTSVTTYAVTTTVTGTAFVLASAVTVAGVALQLSARLASPTGTLTVALIDVTAGNTIIGQVIINISDLPNTNTTSANIGTSNLHIDWTYFKFATPVTTVAGRTYAIRVQASVASQYSIYFTTPGTNMNRALVTTTTQAPVTGDVLIVAGQYTAAGTNANTSVIMNDTGTIQTSTVWVSSKGILRYPTGSTATLTAAGHIVVGFSGTFNIGTSGSPITSTATLNITCVSALQYSIFIYGTMTTQGVTKTVASKLASDVAAGATSSTSTTSTGWKSGDIVVVPSTTRTYTEFETLTLNADAVGTALSHGAYVNAHGGNATTLVQADIANATRNVTIVSTSATFRTNIQMFALSTTSFYYTTFQNLGTGTLVTTSGIGLNALTSGLGTFDFQGNVVTATSGLTTSANTAMFTVNDTATTISNNLFYNLGWTTITPVLNIFGINDANYIIGCLSGNIILLSTYMGSNNVSASNGNYTQTGFYNNATNNSFYSNLNYGLAYTVGSAVNNTGMNNFKMWRNSANGIFLIGGLSNKTAINTFDSLYVFGNGTSNISSLGNKVVGRVLFSNSYFYGGTTLVAPYSIQYGASSTILDGPYFNNCYFGYSNSIGTVSAHSTACILSHSGQSTNFNSCYFGGTEIAFNFVGITNTNLQAMSVSTNHGGTAGSNKLWHNNGTLSTDTIIFNTASPSLRMAPVSATYKLPTTNNKIPIKAGQTCTVSVKVRESIALDGTVYNGTPPRLMYVFNPILGNLAETVGAIYPDYNLITQPETLGSMTLQRTALGTPGTSPSGLTNAYPVIVNNAIPFAYIGASGTNIITSTSYNVFSGARNFSVYVKAAGLNIARIMLGAATTMTGTQYVDVNLNTGEIISVVGGTNAVVETLSGGWYRVSLDVTSVSATNNRFGVGFSDTVKTTGNGVDGVYVWGLQLTDGSGVKPYIAGASWQTLTYTTPAVTNDGIVEFYIDCDGTTGWVNVDDWSTTTFNDTRGTDYWGNSSVYIEADYKVPGATYTFFN